MKNLDGTSLVLVIDAFPFFWSIMFYMESWYVSSCLMVWCSLYPRILTCFIQSSMRYWPLVVCFALPNMVDFIVHCCGNVYKNLLDNQSSLFLLLMDLRYSYPLSSFMISSDVAYFLHMPSSSTSSCLFFYHLSSYIIPF